MLRHLLVSLCLFSVPALAAGTQKSRGEGFQLEATSPALPVIKFRGPQGAHVELKYGPRNDLYNGKTDIPFEVVPKAYWGGIVKWIVTINGAQWAKGDFKLEDRTAYVLTVDDPNGASTDEPVAEPSAPTRPAPQPSAPTQPSPSAGGSPAMAASTFQQLCDALQKESMASSKLSVLKSALRGSRLSVEQVGTLVDQFTYSDDKVNVVRLTHAGLVDPENGFQLLQHFVHDTDKEEVQKLLKGP